MTKEKSPKTNTKLSEAELEKLINKDDEHSRMMIRASGYANRASALRDKLRERAEKTAKKKAKK